MKKKPVLVLVLLFIAVSGAFCWQNTYRASDKAYQDLMTLKYLSGVNFPEMTTPVASSQMANMLNMIDRSKLKPSAQSVYDSLKQELEKPKMLLKYNDVGMQFDAKSTPASVFSNLTNDEYSEENWYVPEKDRLKLYDIRFGFFITKHFFGMIDISGKIKEGHSIDFFNNKFHFITRLNPFNMSKSWPDQAYGSVGTDYMNLVIGRDRVSAGSGVSGNMYLSENRYYDDFGKFSISKFPISYDFTAIVGDGYKNQDTLYTTSFNNEKKLVFIHRLSMTLLKKVTLSAYEGALVYGGNTLSDLRALNPFMFIHNSSSYLTGNTNNFGGLELDWSLAKGLSLNAQFILDQFKLKSESSSTGDTQFGVNVNLKGVWALKKGILSACLEGVYASKGLYLMQSNNSDSGYIEDTLYRYYQVDYISANKRYEEEADEFKYYGYPDGGNIIKFTSQACYSLNKYKFSALASYAIKGPYGIGFNEQRVINRTAGLGVNTGILTFATKFEGQFFKWLKTDVCLANRTYFSYRHIDGLSSNQLQLYLGCRVNLTNLIETK